jgi:hypothetical protein
MPGNKRYNATSRAGIGFEANFDPLQNFLRNVTKSVLICYIEFFMEQAFIVDVSRFCADYGVVFLENENIWYGKSGVSYKRYNLVNNLKTANGMTALPGIANTLLTLDSW